MRSRGEVSTGKKFGEGVVERHPRWTLRDGGSAPGEPGIEDAVSQPCEEGCDPKPGSGGPVAVGLGDSGNQAVAGKASEVVGHACRGVLAEREAQQRGDVSPELGVCKARGEVSQHHHRRK